MLGVAIPIPYLSNLPGVSRPGGASIDYIVKVQPYLDTVNVNSVTIGVRNLGLNYKVDWGDGEITTQTGQNPTHTYDDPRDQEFTVKITASKNAEVPQITQLGVGTAGSNSPERKTLTDIVQFGSRTTLNNQQVFAGCENLGINTNGEITANDLPKVTSADAGRFAFQNCANLNTSKFARLFTSSNMESGIKINNLQSCFVNCTVFNGAGCQDWDVSDVVDFSGMFQSASAYNQPLGNWDTTLGDTFVRMFQNAYAWDQDVSRWNIKNAGVGSTSGFQFWKRDTTSSASYVPISESNASAILVGWAAQTVQTENVLEMEGSILNTDGEVAKTTLESAPQNWNVVLT